MIRPRFCPRKDCRFHEQKNLVKGWYRSAGTYGTFAFGTVLRFQCIHCRKYFSTQTFSLDYYSKRTLNYRRLFDHLITTSSIRDMARDFSVSVDVVLNKLERLGRNCVGVLQEMSNRLTNDEDVVADGIESFTVSQYFPFHLNVLVGKESQTVYWYDYVTLRRKGRMTEEQKRKREELERKFRADPKGVTRSFGELYDRIAHLICDGRRAKVACYTDEHPAYVRARKKQVSINALMGQQRFIHRRINSGKPRSRENPMFSVNYLDRQIRKDLAEHVRETVCFGRNVNRVMDRVAIYLYYHNLRKPYRESKGDYRSHAQVSGLTDCMVKKLQYGVFSRRVFYSKAGIEGVLQKQWLRRYQTPLKERPEYIPKHVAA